MLILEPESYLQAIRALEARADHNLRRPFAYAELRARAAALLRRTCPRARAVRIGQLRIDLASREVTVAGQPVHTSPKECDLLTTRTAEPTRVFAKQELLQNVWGLPRRGEHAHPGHPRLPAERAAGRGRHAHDPSKRGVCYRLIAPTAYPERNGAAPGRPA